MAKGRLGTTTFVSPKPVCTSFSCESDAGSWSFGCDESRKGVVVVVVVSPHCCCCDVKSGRGLAITVDMTAARVKYLSIVCLFMVV